MVEAIRAGDIVAVNHGSGRRREGIVIGSHWDYAGRQILEIQLDPGEVHHAWYPTVTRVKRVIGVPGLPMPKARVERRVYWI